MTNCKGLSPFETSRKVLERVKAEFGDPKTEPPPAESKSPKVKFCSRQTIFSIIVFFSIGIICCFAFRNKPVDSTPEINIAAKAPEANVRGETNKNDSQKAIKDSHVVTKDNTAVQNTPVEKKDLAERSQVSQVQSFKDSIITAKKLFESGDFDEAKKILLPFCEKGNG